MVKKEKQMETGTIGRHIDGHTYVRTERLRQIDRNRKAQTQSY